MSQRYFSPIPIGTAFAKDQPQPGRSTIGYQPEHWNDKGYQAVALQINPMTKLVW